MNTVVRTHKSLAHSYSKFFSTSPFEEKSFWIWTNPLWSHWSEICNSICSFGGTQLKSLTIYGILLLVTGLLTLCLLFRWSLPNLFFNTDFKRVVSTHAKGSAQCAVLNSTTVKKNQAHTKKPKSLPDYPGICLPCGRSSLGWVWICSSVFCSHMNRTQPQSFHTTWPSWARHEPWYFLIWSRREELSFLLEIKSWVPTWLALWYLDVIFYAYSPVYNMFIHTHIILGKDTMSFKPFISVGKEVSRLIWKPIQVTRASLSCTTSWYDCAHNLFPWALFLICDKRSSSITLKIIGLGESCILYHSSRRARWRKCSFITNNLPLPQITWLACTLFQICF